jgi:hypothetical protein
MSNPSRKLMPPIDIIQNISFTSMQKRNHAVLQFAMLCPYV